MRNNKGSVNIGIIIGLVILLIALFAVARTGYGYMGYRGYHHGPSWWYWGGPSYHYGKNVRHGSVKSRSHRGGGFRGGK